MAAQLRCLDPHYGAAESATLFGDRMNVLNVPSARMNSPQSAPVATCLHCAYARRTATALSNQEAGRLERGLRRGRGRARRSGLRFAASAWVNPNRGSDSK